MSALTLHSGRMAIEQIGDQIRIVMTCPTPEEADMTFARISEGLQRGDALQLSQAAEPLPVAIPVIPGPQLKTFYCAAFCLYPEPTVRRFTVKALTIAAAADKAIGAYPQLKKLHVAEAGMGTYLYRGDE